MRVAVNRLRVPPYVAFTMVDDTFFVSDLQLESLRVLARRSDGAAVFVALIDNRGNTVEHPVPRVVTSGVYFPESMIQRIGDFPLTDFGLRVDSPARRGFFDAPGTPEPAPSPTSLAVIATVYGFQAPPYRIADLATPLSTDGRSFTSV
ncbi:MAG TPA: hypothetical protein VMF61_01680 [Candidatus Acidoferrales bacterium]|nr:hypothetical protein [Candidatus Acidoferrales bacterium]